MTTYFDIETGPVSGVLLDLIKPCFTPAKNLRDPEKIKADLAEKEASWLERAALSAMTGRVLAIGFLEESVQCLTGEEKSLLTSFWDKWKEGGRMAGFSIKNFDLPFLTQRSWILGVPVPMDVMEGRYWSHRFVCIQERWCCYSNRTEGQSLDAVCKAMGIGGKSGNGAEFAKLFAENKEAALSYLSRDLELTAELGRRLGVK